MYFELLSSMLIISEYDKLAWNIAELEWSFG